MNEFEFLEKLKHHFNFRFLGDDCAVLPLDEERDLLVTADLLIEDIDFRLSWARPTDIGHKALAVSLSDIAAMGGQGSWAILSLGIPGDLWEERFLIDFYAGIDELAKDSGVEVVGGDISRSPGSFSIDSMVIGTCPRGRAVMRNGASPGELICVTGTLGGAAGGLSLLESEASATLVDPQTRSALIEKQLKPTPKLVHAKMLQTHQLAHSMIDLSDGLSSDLRHICKASGVGAVIYAERVPVDPLLDALVSPGLTSFKSSLDAALHGGEDFELLFTTAPEQRAEVEKLGCTVIGETVGDARTFELDLEGRRESLNAAGYVHFSGRRE